MVENKEVKLGLNVTSSEKVDKAQCWASFTLLRILCSGGEFCKEYKDWITWLKGKFLTGSRIMSRLHWAYLTLTLTLWTLTGASISGGTCCIKCKTTPNCWFLYLGATMKANCWYTSLRSNPSYLHFSLWVDGLIHTSLKPAEILHLPTAYS